MNKYIEFKQISFKGKTKRFEILSKTSFKDCFLCLHKSINDKHLEAFNGTYKNCKECKGTGKIPIILGRISWYSQWRQYTFSPAYPTVWNKDCLEEIKLFLIKLMRERKLK